MCVTSKFASFVQVPCPANCCGIDASSCKQDAGHRQSGQHAFLLKGHFCYFPVLSPLGDT